MDQKHVKSALIEILNFRLGINHSDILESSSMESLGADYLDQVEVLMDLEKKYEFELENYDHYGTMTLDQLSDWIYLHCITKSDSE